MFTVVWTRSARDQLTRIWMTADSLERQAITDYTAEFDRNLHANADRIGESREPSVRVLADVTLGIEFVVSKLDRLATVKRVWRIRPRT